LISAFVLLGCLGVTLIAAKATRLSLQSDERLHLAISTGNMLEAFIRSTDPPRWPDSWEELLESPSSSEFLEHSPERYSTELILDFDATLESIAAQERTELDAIEVNGYPWVEGWRDYLPDVPAAAREMLAGNANKSDP